MECGRRDGVTETHVVEEVRDVEFFRLLPPAVALERYCSVWRPKTPLAVHVPLVSALGRVLAEEVRAAGDLPGFSRSTVDGYACRAKDTFGATETVPALLNLVGEVAIGQVASVSVAPGQAIRIATGAMVPEPLDACVMIEHTEDLGGIIAVQKDAAPGENIIRAGEDISAGETLFGRGHRLGAQDIGALAAIGITSVPVLTRPRVHVISTGNELVHPSDTPGPAQVRDTNGPTLVAALEASGCEAIFCGIVPDQPAALEQALRCALDSGADAVILSGGSSVGPHDLAPGVINSLGSPGVIIHGLAIKPGKPTILALVDDTPVFGLPGHPASALVVFEIAVLPLLEILTGCRYRPLPYEARPKIRAVLERSLSSQHGREDFVRVRLREQDGRIYAMPVLGKSGLISTMAKADGMIRIAFEAGGIEAGESVEVLAWRT